MFPNTEAPRNLHQSIESLVEEMNSLQQLIITSASTPDQEINCPFQKVECFCELLLAPILQGEVQQLILSLISFYGLDPTFQRREQATIDCFAGKHVRQMF
jgi:hypothetical protein